MKKTDVIKHFGTEADVARALEISRQAVNSWPDIIPERAAYKLQVMTAGRLRVDPANYPKAHAQR